MNAKVKADWVAALRSKKYKESHQQLRTVYDEFSALGVLCNIVDKPSYNCGWDLQSIGWRYWWENKTGWTDNSYLGLPTDLKTHIGISDEEEMTIFNMFYYDDKSFYKIADWIEENL